MAKRRARPSTERAEPGEALVSVVFDERAEELARFFAPSLGVEPSVSAVRRALADPALVDARLAAVPALTLGLLEHIVDMGGEAAFLSLTDVAAERLGLDVEAAHAALAVLVDAGFLVPLLRYGDLRSYALLDLSAQTVARRVRGLTLPEVKELPALDGGPDVTLRDRVALIASVAHLPMRFTQALETNRSSVKKLAAIVGREPDEVGEVLDEAIGGGLLGPKDKLLAPIVERLRALARGEVRASEDDANAMRIAEWVGPRWVHREAVVRAVVAAELDRRRGLNHFFGGDAGDFRLAERMVNRAPLLRAKVGEVELVRAADPPERSGHGDGHVTPSFEVMLGPRADPELVATLALATEPGRLDLVLTRRITPKSIHAAIGLGLSAQEILDALGKVGRHGLPDNVRAMVEDWAKSAHTVRISKVWALEASSPEGADAAARALGARVAARPSPTLVLVRDGPDPMGALVAAGVPVDAPTRASRSASKPIAPTLPERPPLSLTPSPDRALRERFAAGRERGFSAPEPRVFVPWCALDALIETLRGEDAELVEELTDIFVRLWDAGEAAFMGWAEPSHLDEAIELIEAHPLAILPWLVLTPRDRRRTLSAAGSLEALIAAARGLDRAPRTTDGMKAERLLRHPRLRELAAPLEAPAPRASPQDERMSPTQIRERFTEAATLGAIVSVRLHGPAGERRLALIPERIHERGRDTALLGVHPETEEGLSIPLAQVIALTPL